MPRIKDGANVIYKGHPHSKGVIERFDHATTDGNVYLVKWSDKHYLFELESDLTVVK